MDTHKPFITADEVLLMFEQTKTGMQYIGESTTLGRVYSLDMLLDEPGDSCFRIVKMNTITLASEEVTEQFAKAWLERHEDEQNSAGFEVEESDERRFPVYVKCSSAWETMKDGIGMAVPLFVEPDHRRYSAPSSEIVRGANV